jgi:MFS family permease
MLNKKEMADRMNKKPFYGWMIVVAGCITFGLANGIPYYNIGFFYDYFQRAFGWSRAEITFGFPLAALLTVWAGPLLVPKFSPRKLIIIGTGSTAAAFLGFGSMRGSLVLYCFLWILYTIGYILSGPIPHQIIVSYWFRKNRGTAMGIIYVGVALVGSLGSFLVKPLTNSYGFRGALMFLGALLFLAWPIAIWVLRDTPAELGLFADGIDELREKKLVEFLSFGTLICNRQFLLLLVGSVCSLGAIGAVNQHMKFVFLDVGFKQGPELDGIWRTASVAILWSSIIGRLAMGYLADRLPVKYVMVAGYFLVAAAVPLLLWVRPPATPYVFSILFGFAMGADYMLIPLMAAEQFGVNTLARAMAILLPVNTIAQTWFPYFVSVLRDRLGSYNLAMTSVFVLALVGAAAIALLPRQAKSVSRTFAETAYRGTGSSVL